MPDENYGFYTSEANALASRRIGGVLADVSADKLARRPALNMIFETLERIVEIDGSEPEPDTVDALARRIAPIFARAGFIPVTAESLRADFGAWMRGGSPVDPSLSRPAAVRAAAASATAATAALAELRLPGLVVAVSSAEPMSDGFCNEEGEAPGDVVVFPWRGQIGGEVYLGCVLMSADGACYLEDIAPGGDAGMASEALRQGVLGEVGETSFKVIGLVLSRLANAISAFNTASSLVGAPDRLSLAMEMREAITVQAVWDGEPIPGQQVDVSPAVPVLDAVGHIRFANEPRRSVPTPVSDEAAYDDAPAPGMR
jgi:hypothetical protein